MSAAEDEDVQKKGLVLLGYNIDSIAAFQTEAVKGVILNQQYITKAVPLRFSVFHYLYNSPALRVAMSLTLTLLGRELRLRFRDHFGECMF